MEEHRLDIILFQVPVQGHSEVCNGTERLESRSRGSCFIVVDAILLSVPFCDIPDLVVDHCPCVIPFPFADQLALQGANSTWDIGTWDENKYLEFLETAYLIMTTSNPILLLRRLQGLMPFWFILQVRLEGAIHNGGYKVWYRSSISGCNVKGEEVM